MAGGVDLGGNQLTATRRRSLAGKSGWAGLVHNRRIFAIAVFASLGGLLYGYNQGVFSGVLAMHSFEQRMASAVGHSGTKGWLVAILELGAWAGVLMTGRFVTGLGVGSLSMAVPLYNAEIAPPEVRGSLVALQQLAITFGIMISFWIDYGTNYIGGTGDSQKEAAWRLPLALQLVPAVILGVGILFMPFSPRWLVNEGRDDEALAVLSSARGLPPDSDLVQIEFFYLFALLPLKRELREIRAQYIFEKETSEANFPQYQDGSFSSNFKLGFYDYLSLLTNRTVESVRPFSSLTATHIAIAGVNAILYYAPSIFQSLGLTGNSVSLLATGVVGISMFLATIPAVLWVDQLGRKPVLISGAFLMAACHIIVAALTGVYHNTWASHVAAGWVACSFVWIFAIGEKLIRLVEGPRLMHVKASGIAGIWPLSVRGKGLSIAASSNWMNNFIVGEVTPIMQEKLGFGTFVFFGTFSLLGGLFVLFFVPETKGLSLEEMDDVFGSSKGLAIADQQRQEAIYRRLGLLVDNEDRLSDEKASSTKEEP
ncbi:hypothetical protein DXG01_004177 [Tephrocybe rancida]|nr:hypothetical protein DXG01_004177 [Tephrocybe rancida]